MLKSSLFVLLFLLIGGIGQARVWTDSLGRKFEGTLIRKDGDSVVLDIGGRQRTLAFSQLSPADQAYLKGGRSRRSSAKESVPSVQASKAQIQANTGIQVVRLSADTVNKRWSYGSPNFEFICDDDLGLPVVREFAWMFESVWQFAARKPFDLPRLRAQQKVRMKTYLIKSYADYVKMGGPPKSGGVFISSRDIILIPYQSLGITNHGGRYRVDSKVGNYTLRHEVAHQLMLGQSQQAGWFIEGSAEYIATVPYQQTRMLVSHHQKSVIDYLTAYGWNGQGGRNLGRNLKLARLESLMNPDYATFQKQPNAYASALLLYYYFMKFDGKRDGAALAAYVGELQYGRPEFVAREKLLAGRSYAELEKQMAAAWNQVGIRLTFE
ncbi:hypothetical protein AAFN60_08250 [Roseibacillus persicicus]|uniref:hypothetical protein n=1 Tax=Roseibacillus persicicus TaxID=454148 RepID=UPI00398AF75F